MRFRLFFLVIIVSGWAASGAAQEITVTLAQRTALDNDGFHIQGLRAAPTETLTLPGVDTTGASFLEVFYSWDIPDDHMVSALVLPGEDGQTLFVDLNNDEDLTNDGDPLFFPFDQNELQFFLVDASDPEQRAGRSLQRVPNYALGDSVQTAFIFDEAGHLKERWVDFWKQHNPDLDGSPNTYFFDQYVDLSRGTVELDGVAYAVALHDYNQTGRFDDVENARKPTSVDRFIIDLGRDGKLTSRVTTEIFKLNDIFEVAGKRYRLQNVDPYGRSVTLVETDVLSQGVRRATRRRRRGLERDARRKLLGSGADDDRGRDPRHAKPARALRAAELLGRVVRPLPR